MKKTALVIMALMLMLSFIACSAKGPTAEEVRPWKKAEWQAASENDRIAALAAIIAADRDDIDPEGSAEASVEGFNTYFASVDAEKSLTLGEVFDESVIEEDIDTPTENTEEEQASAEPEK